MASILRCGMCLSMYILYFCFHWQNKVCFWSRYTGMRTIYRSCIQGDVLQCDEFVDVLINFMEIYYSHAIRGIGGICL